MTPIKQILDGALATASEQEIFDYIGAMLLRQGEPSQLYNDEGEMVNCAYRGASYVTGAPLKCAIGHCISDERYAEFEGDLLEGTDAEGVLAHLDICVDADRSRFLLDLQEVHDSNMPDAWHIELMVKAGAYGLVYDEDRLRNAEIVS